MFTALALGILIGVALAPNPAEMTRLVERVEEDNRTTRDFRLRELEDLKTQLRNYRDFGKQARGRLVKDRLAGVRVAILLDHEFRQDPIGADLKAVLTQAGAAIASTTTLTRSFVALDPDLGNRAAASLGLLAVSGENLQMVLARELADAVAAGRPQTIGSLKANGLIRCSGDSDFSRPAQAVLLVSGMSAEGQADLDNVDLPLVRRLTEAGLRVVACERERTNFSAAPAFKSAKISTVDNVDSELGHVALVYALGGEVGNFGVKPTADRLLPDLGAALAR